MTVDLELERGYRLVGDLSTPEAALAARSWRRRSAPPSRTA
jgi:hypothetical protein